MSYSLGAWNGRPLGCATFISSDTQPNIAAVHSNGTLEGQANARLIAAAPELLAALKEIRLNMQNDAFVDPVKREMYMAILDAAIAKAEVAQ